MKNKTKIVHIYIVDAIDEGVVAAVTHGKPVGAKPQYVYVFILVDILPGDVQYIIKLQREPADSKQ